MRGFPRKRRQGEEGIDEREDDGGNEKEAGEKGKCMRDKGNKRGLGRTGVRIGWGGDRRGREGRGEKKRWGEGGDRGEQDI